MYLFIECQLIVKTFLTNRMLLKNAGTCVKKGQEKSTVSIKVQSISFIKFKGTIHNHTTYGMPFSKTFSNEQFDYVMVEQFLETEAC